jgi:hypothetical protein
MGTEIEKMRKDVERNINQTINLEENTYMTQLLNQDSIYYSKLNDLINFYPLYKLNNTPSNQTKYGSQLSIVNGVTQTIKTIISSIQTKIETSTQSLQATDREIKNLNETYNNLNRYDGDYKQLDLTSKRLLKDYVNIYSTQRIMVWIKGIILLFLVYKLVSAAVKYEQIWLYVMLWFVGMIILYVLNYVYYVWNSSVTLPEGATINSVDPNAVPLTCQNTEFGCCPDGVTVSNKTKTNCGCAKSAFGCCPDGSNKNSDGTCTPYNPNPLPCNQTEYGCCPDNTTISDATGSNCRNRPINEPPLCSRTQYGCCPDGGTISNVDRSNCPGSCSFSEFGCCPNGVTISNRDRSNCIVPMCTSTKYGCCPNGNPRNKTGTNC